VSICLLDTGVNNGHTLLAPFLSDSDLHAFDSQWGVNDYIQPHQQHGTLVSGIAVYGDLSQILSSNTPVVVKHCLESVKIYCAWYLISIWSALPKPAIIIKTIFFDFVIILNRDEQNASFAKL
ncbi:MAG: S8 family serine peptidase, partial [Sphaerochaetaceae bacterium]|nr:S8 family serine peptidase [Sphaerochaetaceae bacterium]